MTSTQSVLRTDAVEIAELVRWVTEGRVRIPRFQRGLRWNFRDVQRLFESIAEDYPIGNLLLWEREVAETDIQIGSLRFHAPAEPQGLLVVDGQQRLTSLANALSVEGLRDSRFALSYDLEKQVFVRYRSDGPEIPLPDVFDGRRLIAWFRARPEFDKQDLFDRANSLGTTIRQFKVPVYTVRRSDEATLRDIFDRMNTYGKPLARTDVFSALHGQQDGERRLGDKSEFAQIAESINERTGFGLLHDDTVLLSYLARRGPEIRREIRNEFSQEKNANTIDQCFLNEDEDEARCGAALAIENAVRFLQEEASIPHLAFLPYRFIIVVLARFFAHHSRPASASLRDLRRFTWRAATGKDSGTAVTRLLTSKIDPAEEHESIARLLEAVTDRVPFRLNQFRTNYAATRITLCAMWDAQPMRLEAAVVDSDNPDDQHYTRDDLSLALDGAATANNVAIRIQPGAAYSTSAGNRLLLPEPGQVSQELLETLGRTALQAQEGGVDAAAVLASHVITVDAQKALVAHDTDRFVTIREEAVEQRTLDFLETRAEWTFESTPPLSTFEVDDDDSDERDDIFPLAPAQFAE